MATCPAGSRRDELPGGARMARAKQGVVGYGHQESADIRVKKPLRVVNG